MTKQQKIDAIYAKIANKELSFWCEIKKWNVFLKIIWSEVWWTFILIWPWFRKYIAEIEEIAKSKIIGHPVMIGDVMEYFNEWNIVISWFEWMQKSEIIKWEKTLHLINFWKKLTKPIEDQTDDCIDFVYNLISE